MLCISRREESRLVMDTADGEIVMTIRKSRGGIAKLGIEAPKSVKVLRKELKDKEKRHGIRE